MKARSTIYNVNSTERGAALLTVLVALLLISLMTLELQYTSLIERKLAYNDLNHLQAYYLAKSGVHLGLLRINLYGRALNDPKFNTDAIAPYLDSIWNLPIPPFPPEEAALAKVSLQEKSEQEELLKETRVSAGQTTHTIISESGKINLNLLDHDLSSITSAPNFRDPKNLTEHTGFRLINLMNELLRTSENPNEEYGNLRPEEIVLNILDWIAPTDTSFGVGNRDSWYEQQVPPYKAKRARFFTLDELKLVKDVTPYLYSKMKSRLTVNSGDGKIDINAGDVDYRVLYPDFTDRDITELRARKEQLGGRWPSVTEFKNFVTSTLGRTGFSTFYPQPEEYLSIGSRSFLVKGQGLIKRSGSNIQSTITVGVALLADGGGVNMALTTQATCEKDDTHVFVAGKCYATPTNDNDCRSFVAGLASPAVDNGKAGCRVSRDGGVKFFPYPTTTTTAKLKPKSLKIVSWVES